MYVGLLKKIPLFTILNTKIPNPGPAPGCEHQTSASSTSSSTMAGGTASCSDIRPRPSPGTGSGAVVDLATAHLAQVVLVDDCSRTVGHGCTTRKRPPWLAPCGMSVATPLPGSMRRPLPLVVTGFRALEPESEGLLGDGRE